MRWESICRSLARSGCSVHILGGEKKQLWRLKNCRDMSTFLPPSCRSFLHEFRDWKNQIEPSSQRLFFHAQRGIPSAANFRAVSAHLAGHFFWTNLAKVTEGGKRLARERCKEDHRVCNSILGLFFSHRGGLSPLHLGFPVVKISEWKSYVFLSSSHVHLHTDEERAH